MFLPEMYHVVLNLYSLSAIIILVSSSSFRIPLYPVQDWNATNSQVDEGYYINLDIGKPAQRMQVLIDTGSSNLAISAVPNVKLDTYFNYNESKTLLTNKEKISVRYTIGSWQGFLAKELVSVPSNPPLAVNVNLACIETENGFFPVASKWQGILGMAYSSVAKPVSLVPFFDSLVKSGKIKKDIFSLYMCGPFATESGIIGELLLGDLEGSLYSGSILYTPIHREWYYEVILVDLKVGNYSWPHKCSELNINHTIVDTGTSDLLLPQSVLSWTINIMKNKTESLHIPDAFWSRTSSICMTDPKAINLFPMIKLSLAKHGKKMFSLVITPEMYLQKSSSGIEDCYYFSIGLASKGTVLGASVLKGYYVIFDRQNKQVGFANMSCLSKISKFIAAVTEVETSKNDMVDCIYSFSDDSGEVGLRIAAYVIASICLICAIPFLIMLTRWIWKHIICRHSDSSENSSLVEGN